MITYGLVVVFAAWVAGNTRPGLALRRALAPSLREHVQYVFATAALLLLLVVIWGPFPSTREVIPVLGFAILLGLGVETLRGRPRGSSPTRNSATPRTRCASGTQRRHSTARRGLGARVQRLDRHSRIRW